MAAEATMIVIDNSYAAVENSYVFKTQLEAIRIYCFAKIMPNPNNIVGLGFMAAGCFPYPVRPTSDVKHFLTHTLGNVDFGDATSLTGGLQFSQLGFTRVPEDMKLRMLMFVAGPGNLSPYVEKLGRRLKEKNIALDVVSFVDQNPEFDAEKTKALTELVAAANNENNSHFAHVPHNSSVRKILVRSGILTRKEAAAVPTTKEELKKKKDKKKWEWIRKKKKNRSEKHSKDLEQHSTSAA